MRADAGLADRVDVVKRRAEPDRLDDRRRSRLEFVRRLAVSDAILKHLMNHFAAAIERRHRRKMLVLTIKRADAGRPVNLMSSKDIEIAVNVANIDVEVDRCLRAIDQHPNSTRMVIAPD